MRTAMNGTEEDLVRLVAKLTEKYTRKESTSITYATAEKLMGAVIYTLREAEDFVTDEQETQLFVKGSYDLEGAYRKGYEVILSKTSMAQKFYNEMIQEFFDYGNRCYFETVVKGFPAFFLYYDTKFEPQNHILTLDYPILSDLHLEQGINLIEQYLWAIEMEQVFLGSFERTDILQLLSDFHKDYPELIINICEVVLRNAIGCMLSGHTPFMLRIDVEDYPFISQKVHQMKQKDLEQEIRELLQKMVLQYFGNNLKLVRYLQNDVHNFCVSLYNAVEHNCLNRIFP